LRFDFKGGDYLGNLTKSIEIEASPEEVFSFCMDTKKMNEASKGFAEQEYTSEGPVGVGTTRHHIAKIGGQEREMDMEITEFVKNKKISDHTIGASKAKIAGSWTFEPTAKGTKLTVSTDYEVPYSVLGKVIDKLKLSKEMDKTMGKLLENIKKALEA
jgi:carbon monoxide dehydrogenase subunit G